jgi:single-strand selective monofunctional uracil DNA glycosylase
MSPVNISRWLSREVNLLQFGTPITCVYNPLVYARKPHESYLKQHAKQGIDVLFLGMNPGPWGMAQTGVPFGEISLVRDFLGIDEVVRQPPIIHPKRPIDGFSCTRSEVSGKRLWGWVQNRFKKVSAFNKRFFVANYCPLVFMEESGRNRTPDKLPAREYEPLFQACDEALRRLVEWCQPKHVIGVGKFAESRALAAMSNSNISIGTILHPSPASPAANRGWQKQVEKQLHSQGIKI